MTQFMSGAIMMACFVAGLFFFRFWRESRDRLFAIFAVAFWVLGANRIGFIFVDEAEEARTLLYVVRLLAFLLILAAIIDKNRARKSRR